MSASPWSVLHSAAHRGDEAAVAEALSQQDDNGLVVATTVQGDTALHLAAHSSSGACVRRLLQAGAPVNALNHGGWSPLMLALLSDASVPRRLDCIAPLLSHGANITHEEGSCREKGGWCALLLAAQRGDSAALALLVDTARRSGSDASVAALLGGLATAQGDGALHLACHAGSEACVRLLLTAGAPVAALNKKGLDPLTLALSAACAEEADHGDVQTASWERILTLLDAASARTSDARPVALPFRRDGSRLLRMLAAAPAAVPLRRLCALCALLRRLGCADDSPDASDEGHDERASVVAARRGRHTLAALIRAPMPPRRCLVCIRQPLEGASPDSICVLEGAIDRAPLETEHEGLRRAVLLTCRPAEHALRDHHQAESALENEAAAEAETAAYDSATAAIGGVRRRWRAFRLAGDLPPGDGEDELPSRAALTAVVSAHASARAAIAAAGDLLGEQISHACGTAHHALEPQSAEPDGSAAAEAAAATRGLTAYYRQCRRWIDVDLGDGDGDGTPAGTKGRCADSAIEMLELRPLTSAPLLHDTHMQMLREVLGADAIDEDDDGRHRPWSIYAEDLSVSSPAELRSAPHRPKVEPQACKHSGTTAMGNEKGGWHAAAEVFSLDTPLLMAFAAEEAERALHMAVADSEDSAAEEEEEEQAPTPMDAE